MLVAAVAVVVVLVTAAQTDALTCANATATIVGTGTIEGTSGDDVIVGSSGAE